MYVCSFFSNNLVNFRKKILLNTFDKSTNYMDQVMLIYIIVKTDTFYLLQNVKTIVYLNMFNFSVNT